MPPLHPLWQALQCLQSSTIKQVNNRLLTGLPVQGPSYAALIAHRVWGSHPTRHRWAGFTLAGAAVW